MNASKLCGFVLLAAGSLLFAGCDPVRTTSQTMRLLVIESPSNKVASGAQVSLKFDHPTDAPRDSHWRTASEEYKRYRLNEWKRGPWSQDVTDNNGLVRMRVEHTSLDRTRGPEPPAALDWFTGEPYLIRVRHGDTPEETFRLVVTPGLSVTGKSYTIVILTIDRPVYVDSSR